MKITVVTYYDHDNNKKHKKLNGHLKWERIIKYNYINQLYMVDWQDNFNTVKGWVFRGDKVFEYHKIKG